MLGRERGVRGGLDADDAAALGARADHLVGFIRGCPRRARAPAWVMKTGAFDDADVSMQVWSPECEMSIAMPSLFIRSTARSAERGQPAVAGSLRPAPSMFASE